MANIHTQRTVVKASLSVLLSGIFTKMVEMEFAT